MMMNSSGIETNKNWHKWNNSTFAGKFRNREDVMNYIWMYVYIVERLRLIAKSN